MARYWATWARILANAKAMPFCSQHLWMVDAFAGNGLHESSTDPDGIVRGTSVQAALAAKGVQAEVPDAAVHIRAVEVNQGRAAQLRTALSSYVRDGVDATVACADWLDEVPRILSDIAREDHQHNGRPIPGRGHQHRALWLLDPYGPSQLDRAVIENLPYGSEVVINLDVAGLMRQVGKAERGDVEAELRLHKLFGGSGWRGTRSRAIDGAYAATFAGTFKFRNAYPLRHTGNQRRSLLHLTNSPKAVKPFAKAHEIATSVFRLVAGTRMSTQQKDLAVVELFEVFRRQTVTTREMRSVSGRFDLVQLRGICAAADAGRYGRWRPKELTMEWFSERAPEPPPPTLGL
jgi:three-Cys-motif partner protein